MDLDSLSNGGDGAKHVCDLDNNCKGYYQNQNSDNVWQAAALKLPDDCTTKDTTSTLTWNTFWKKNM